MKNLSKKLMCSLLTASLMCPMLITPIYAQSDTEVKVDGTTGTPLGGFGTGGVKFNARLGSFAAITKSPADANDYKALSGAKFQLYTNRNGSVKTVDTMKSVVKDGRSDDDAIWPMHYANMGETNGVQVDLTAFAPLDALNSDNMSMPYAFYEMELTNTADTATDVSCAFQLTTDDIPSYVDGKGFSSKKWAIYADSENNNAIVTVGNDSGFASKGEFNNTVTEKTNNVAVKVSLDSNETTTVKFVLSWYDNSEPDWHYYLNLYNNPGDIAEHGLEIFDEIKSNGEALVTKMRASNIPYWYRNQVQNTLVNLTNNSMYKKDGRVAYAEGQWTCFGTMDQMWQARQIVAQLVPFFAWRELEYWARTQRNDGQIHHDFNTEVENKADRAELIAWDHTEHADYRNIDKWVDVNCALIISVYETMQIAGNPTTDGIILGKDPIPEGTTMLEYFWPYMKKAGDRILKQVELYGSKTYPYTFDHSENSYDAGGDPNAFNASISAVAYKIMTQLATELGESDEAQKYNTAYETVVDSYAKRYLSDNFPEDKRVSEGFFAGQWLAMHLKLGQIWTDEQTDYVLEQLDSFYHPYYWGMGTMKGTYDEWTPYTLMHYGGLLLHTRRENIFEAMHKDSYNRQYTDRNKVFNHPLDILPSVSTPNYAATTISGDKQYISMPGLWRNYNDLVGYYRDQRTKEIWVQPRLLESMNGKMENAMFVMPEGYGTVSCTESGEVNQNQSITVTSDNPIEVTKIHLLDNFDDADPVVKLNGEEVTYTRVGTGYDKELVVEWNGTLDETGIIIETSGDPGYELTALPEMPNYGPDDNASSDIKDAYSSISATSAESKVKVDVVTPVGQDWYVRNQFNYDSHIILKNVDFSDIGANMINAKVSSVYDGFTLQIKLDAVSNEVIGTVEVPNTGGETDWKDVSAMLNEVVTGVHDVYVVFDAAGASGEELKYVNLSSIKFLAADGRLDRTNWTGKASNNSSSLSAAWDNDISSKWHCSYQEVGKWITVDFGSVQKFNRIVLDNNTKATDHLRGYKLSVSNDGTNYDVVQTGRTEQETVVTIDFAEQQARYIKIEITEADTSKYWAIYEMNVFLYEEEPGEELDPSIAGIYSGNASNHPNGTGYFNLTKYNNNTGNARVNANTSRAYFVDGINENVKALFADENDSTMLKESFSQYYVNYIGKNIAKETVYDIKPAIVGASLPAGNYTIYYFGGNLLPVTVDLPESSAYTVDTSKDSYEFATIGTKTHRMKEISLTLTEDYNGDITFYNENGWLPDVYSVTIVNADALDTPSTPEPSPEVTPSPSPEVTPSPSPDTFSINGNTITVTLPNVSNAVLIKVTFDENGRIAKLTSTTLTFENDSASATLDKIENGDKIMILDSLSYIKPLTDAVTITSEE